MYVCCVDVFVVVLTLLQTGNVFFSKVVTDSIPNAVKSTIRATNFVLYVWRGFFFTVYISTMCFTRPSCSFDLLCNKNSL